MMKSFFYTINLSPILLNILILMIFSAPYKNNKFNPFTLMFLLILTTILISIKMNMIMKSWSSFILFLIMIGGLMIIFMYIVSLMNNELFMMNYKNIMFIGFKIIIMNLVIFMFYKNYMNLNNFTWYNNQNNFIMLNFYEIYMNYYNNVTMFIIIYLFYSMICIMNICYKFKAPLRQLFF